MKRFTVFAGFLICAGLLIGSASAISVSSVTVDPTADLHPKEKVTASFVVDATGLPDFDDLKFYTDLDKPLWVYSVIVDGVNLPRPQENSKNFSSNYLQFNHIPNFRPQVFINVTLTGVTPTAPKSSLTIFNVTELDTNGRPILSTRFERIARISGPDQTAAATSTPTLTKTSQRVTATTTTTPTIVNDYDYIKPPEPITVEGTFYGFLRWFKGLFGIQS